MGNLLSVIDSLSRRPSILNSVLSKVMSKVLPMENGYAYCNSLQCFYYKYQVQPGFCESYYMCVYCSVTKAGCDCSSTCQSCCPLGAGPEK